MKIYGKMERAEHPGVIDSTKSPLILIFNDDNELQAFIKKLVSTPVLTKGMRVISFLPHGVPEDHPVIDVVLRLIQSGDGFIEGKGITDEARKTLPTEDEIRKLGKNEED